MSEEPRLYGADWVRLRNDVLARDGHQCANCEAEADLEVHHVVPLSRGGTNRVTNLLTVCRACHNGAHGRSAEIEDGDTGSESGRIRWLPTIEDVRRLVRSTPHPLKQAIITLLAKTGLGAGEICNLLLEDIALADDDTRESFDVPLPSWADGTASLIRIRGTDDETLWPPRRERSEATTVPLDGKLCWVLRRWLAVRPDPIGTSKPLFARTNSKWGASLSIHVVHHLVESRAKPLELHGHDDQLDNLTPYTLRYFFDERFAGQPTVREYVLGRHSTLAVSPERLAAQYADSIYNLM